MDAAAASVAAQRYSIARYPTAMIDRVRLADGRVVTVRPVLPQDAELTRDFVAGLSPDARYRRFHMGVGELPSAVLRHFTEIDYTGHLALLAGVVGDDGAEFQVADARYVLDAEPAADGGQDADFALVVADDWQGAGLGSDLVRRMVRAARARGLARLHGEVLAGNEPMLRLLRGLGARLRGRIGDARLVDAWIDLRQASG